MQDYYLIFLLKYIIIIIQGKERKKSQRKKIKKVLDIQSTLCYNKREERGKGLTTQPKGARKKIKKVEKIS